MSEVVSFSAFTPPARYDAIPWEQVRIKEAPTEDGPWTTIDTLAITPDVDPADPAAQSFTTSNGTAVDRWYTVTFIDGASNESEPTLPLQNKQDLSLPSETPYATASELAELLRVDATERATELDRCLAAAAAEINAELGRSAPFDDPPPALVAEVNLERAVEHWKQMESPFGLIGLGGAETPAFSATDSWNRHAAKLSPLKESWGLA